MDAVTFLILNYQFNDNPFDWWYPV